MIATAASHTPSASASQRLTAMRWRDGSGISRLTGLTVSRYSTITRESNSVAPSSITRTGILPSGLNRGTVDSGPYGDSWTTVHSIFFSASATRTLRAYGLVGEAISFIEAGG